MLQTICLLCMRTQVYNCRANTPVVHRFHISFISFYHPHALCAYCAHICFNICNASVNKLLLCRNLASLHVFKFNICKSNAQQNKLVSGNITQTTHAIYLRTLKPENL